MIDRLEYQDFIGSVHYSDKDEVFFGKLEGVSDLVTFEGSSVKELKKALLMQSRTINICVRPQERMH